MSPPISLPLVIVAVAYMTCLLRFRQIHINIRVAHLQYRCPSNLILANDENLEYFKTYEKEIPVPGKTCKEDAGINYI